MIDSGESEGRASSWCIEELPRVERTTDGSFNRSHSWKTYPNAPQRSRGSAICSSAPPVSTSYDEGNGTPESVHRKRMAPTMTFATISSIKPNSFSIQLVASSGSQQ